MAPVWQDEPRNPFVPAQHAAAQAAERVWTAERRAGVPPAAEQRDAVAYWEDCPSGAGLGPIRGPEHFRATQVPAGMAMARGWVWYANPPDRVEAASPAELPCWTEA